MTHKAKKTSLHKNKTLARTGRVHNCFGFCGRLLKHLSDRSSAAKDCCTSTPHNLNQPKMRAYWFDNEAGDQREPHDSGRNVDPDYLRKLGISHHVCPSISEVDAIANERGYKNRDEITISPEKMGDAYEDKMKMFFNEHLHEDEEIRYMLDGGGYFDCRGKDDDWVSLSIGGIPSLVQKHVFGRRME